MYDHEYSSTFEAIRAAGREAGRPLSFIEIARIVAQDQKIVAEVMRINAELETLGPGSLDGELIALRLGFPVNFTIVFLRACQAALQGICLYIDVSGTAMNAPSTARLQ
jgi:hypothetical protein